MGNTKRTYLRGFTIVELLIVVVVIAILAAITIVAYNGIQQRTKNTAIIDAASKSQRLISAYIALNNAYPTAPQGEYICITVDTTCRRNTPDVAGNSTFEAAMATVGKLPRFAPLVSDVRGGVTYHYSSSRIVNGISSPAILSFYILGAYADCGMPVLTGEGDSISSSSNKYTIGNVGSSGATQCVVKIDGPAA